MRKFFLFGIFVILVAVMMFFFGWTQFSVPAGRYGVLLSKSGGYYSTPITSGGVTWRWERLIPTNSKLLLFDLSQRRINYSVEGSLPSADLYSTVLSSKDDFAWEFSVDALVTLKPNALVAVVSGKKIHTQAALNTYIDSQISSALDSIMREYIAALLDDAYLYQKIKIDNYTFTENIKTALINKIGNDCVVDAVTILKLKIPDLNTYKIAEQAYAEYEQRREMLLAETAAREAQRAASEQFHIERLTKWGNFLAKYPKILELIAVAQHDSKAVADALKLLNNDSAAADSVVVPN